MLIVEVLPRIPIGNPYPEIHPLSIGVKRAMLFHNLYTTYSSEFLSTNSRARLVERASQEREMVGGGSGDRVFEYYYTKGAFVCFNRQQQHSDALTARSLFSRRMQVKWRQPCIREVEPTQLIWVLQASTRSREMVRSMAGKVNP